MEKLLTIREAARILHVHPNTLRNNLEIPNYRLGNRGDRRYLESDLIKYLEERKEG